MNLKLLIPILMLSSILFSQNQNEINKIIENYDMDEIYKMIDQFQENEKIKNEKIESYLKNNPKVKKTFYRNGSKHILFDIIENRPVYVSSDNQISASVTNTNSLHPGGSLNLDLEGNDMTIGVWEIDHPLSSHVEFQDDQGNSRISIIDEANPEVDFHATHVTGTIGASGVNQSAKGMAPKSSIIAYNSNGDNGEVTMAHTSTGMLISNHSYGVYIYDDETNEQQVPDWYMGSYHSPGITWDQIHRNSPKYLKVTSAGNSGLRSYPNGLGSGLDKLTADKNSKNSLIVASAQISINPFSNGISSLKISSFSSQGPTDDGRIKPDITGRGESVFSTSNDPNDLYGSSQGTSMSSPGVAGSLLLLQELSNDLFDNFMNSSTLRGLVCHTAKDDADMSEFITGPVYEGPDPFWGWGLLNTELAAQTMINTQSSTSIIEENTLDNGSSYSITVNVTDNEKLKATLCWTDLAGPSQSGILNSTTAVLVNDLDLRITDNESNEYFPWKLDLNNLPNATKGDNLVDNIEQVEIDLPASGQYTITVSHKGILSGQNITNSQNYSLIITGANMTLSDPSNEISNLMVWPNPAKDFINFQISSINSGSTTVSLVDIRGRKVYQNTFNSQNIIRSEIKTSNFAKGVYILNIQQGNKNLNKKVIIK